MRSLDSPPRTPLPRRPVIALVALAAVLAGALSAAPEAGATMTGPCRAEIAGQDFAPLFTGPRDDAVPVDRTRLVSVTMAAQRPLNRLKIELEFAGLRIPVHDRPTTGTSWASEVPVEDYGLYGMGLWKVVASSEGNGFTCEAAALIDVQDDHALDPLATISGLGGLALALIGALGILAVAARIGKSKAAPISGALLGVLLGIGVCVLLQQFSVLYPTVGVAVALVAAGAAVGLGFSVFGLPGRESDARAEVR
jgi:hypothetical protein